MRALDAKKLGKRLKNLRNEVDLEQDAIARVLQIPRTAVSAYENGLRVVTALELEQLCKLFRTSPNDILGWMSKRQIKLAAKDGSHDISNQEGSEE